MATTTLARAFSTKAAAAVLGATALCGVAVAAGTGNLSSLGGGSTEPEHTLSGGALGGSAGPGTAPGFRPGGSAPDGSVKPSGAGAQQVGPSASPRPGTPSADGHGGQPFAPALVELCRGFTDREGKGERPGQLVTEPQFGPLVAEAGGADKVARYCDEALDAQGGDSRPGAGGQSHDPGRATSSPGAGKGSGSGNDTKGGGDGNANGGAKPGKPGVTAPALPTVPTPPAVRPSKSDHPDGSTAER